MRFTGTLLILPLMAGFAGLAFAREQGASHDEVREALRRSLAFVENEGVAWMREQGCVSCHQTTFLLWTHHEARRRGLAVDVAKLRDWENWSLVVVLAGCDGGTPQGADTLSQMLLARDASSPWFVKPVKTHRTADPFENVLKHLLAEQKEDGHWDAGGQSENPPEIPTRWALLALKSREDFMRHEGPDPDPRRVLGPGLKRLMEPNDAALPKAREKALAWLEKNGAPKPDELNEGAVLRLLMANAFADAANSGRVTKELLSRQNADGGWSANPKQQAKGSDAFATGQALYALSSNGGNDAATSVAVDRARRFLLTTQAGDGSWRVPTSAIHPPSGKKERDARTDEVYHYWGTAWGTLGLLHALPNGSDKASAAR